jgi:hypothetical protein
LLGVVAGVTAALVSGADGPPAGVEWAEAAASPAAACELPVVATVATAIPPAVVAAAAAAMTAAAFAWPASNVVKVEVFIRANLRETGVPAERAHCSYRRRGPHRYSP